MESIASLSDTELLLKLRLGEKVAFRVLFERYWERLYKAAKAKVNSQETAEEIVQDIFVDIWVRRNVLNIEDLEGYLFRAVKHKFLDYVRAQIVRRHYEEYVLFIPSNQNNTDEEIAFLELQTAFYEGLRELPSKTREIFTLSRLDGLSTKEISDTLDIPVRTVSHHLFKAVKLLRLKLKDFIPTLYFVFLYEYLI